MNLQTIFKPTIHVNVLENLGNAPKTIFLIWVTEIYLQVRPCLSVFKVDVGMFKFKV
jgi:hypothetical protein